MPRRLERKPLGALIGARLENGAIRCREAERPKVGEARSSEAGLIPLLKVGAALKVPSVPVKVTSAP